MLLLKVYILNSISLSMFWLPQFAFSNACYHLIYDAWRLATLMSITVNCRSEFLIDVRVTFVMWWSNSGSSDSYDDLLKLHLTDNYFFFCLAGKYNCVHVHLVQCNHLWKATAERWKLSVYQQLFWFSFQVINTLF